MAANPAKNTGGSPLTIHTGAGVRVSRPSPVAMNGWTNRLATAWHASLRAPVGRRRIALGLAPVA
jgi:hypothetical protein